MPDDVVAVVGIDPSLSATGLAVWRADGQHTVTTLETASGETTERRWHQIAVRIWPHLTRRTVVVMEGAVDVARRGSTTQDLAELRGVLRYGLFLRGVPYVQPRPTTLKKFAGNGSWGKETMQVAARSQLATPIGWARTFDEADALWCAAFGLHKIGRPVVDATPRRAEAVMVVDWPNLSRITTPENGDTPCKP